jgi:nicotinamidase-related amidase
MGEYRHKATGEVKTQGEWRSANPNISMPRTWNQNVLDALNIEAVFEAPKPDVGPYQSAARNGVTQDANGNWVQAWSVVDMFSDYTDEDGVLHTKAEQEAAYQANLDAEAAKAVRSQRDSLLAATDWRALSDVTMSAEMATYRQALRDITAQEGFPHSVNWPAKP